MFPFPVLCIYFTSLALVFDVSIFQASPNYFVHIQLLQHLTENVCIRNRFIAEACINTKQPAKETRKCVTLKLIKNKIC